MNIITLDNIYLREMTINDFKKIKLILANKNVMYAYEGPFNDEEIKQWITKQINNYRASGYGLWAVCDIKTNSII